MPTSATVYPLDAAAASRAAPLSSLSAPQRGAWAAAFAALRDGGLLSLLMLGGSMARGVGCSPDDTLTAACSYSARFAATLRTASPKARVLYDNRAVGGMTTGSALLSLPSLSASLVPPPATGGGRRGDRGGVGEVILIDFSINDAFEAQVYRRSVAPSVYGRARAALGAEPWSKRRAYLQVLAATEAMVRHLLVHAPSAALLLVEGSCWPSSRNTTEAHAHVAAHYGVGFLNFRSALRRGIVPIGLPSDAPKLKALKGFVKGADGVARHGTCDACIRGRKCGEQPRASTTPTIFSDGKHPDHRGHQYVAEAIGFVIDAWRQQLQQPANTELPPPAASAARLPEPLSHPDLLAQHEVCERPTTVHSASAALGAALASAGASARRRPADAALEPLHPSSPAFVGGGNVSVTSGDWRLYEDRRGKPGWITSGRTNGARVCARWHILVYPLQPPHPNPVPPTNPTHPPHTGSTIEFPVTFGRSPRLTVAWTLGYEGFGHVAVGFTAARHAGEVKMLEGKREDGVRVTQATVLDMAVGHMKHGSQRHLAGGIAGWGIAPFSSERFRVELRCPEVGECGKFKILEIRAC